MTPSRSVASLKRRLPTHRLRETERKCVGRSYFRYLLGICQVLTSFFLASCAFAIFFVQRSSNHDDELGSLAKAISASRQIEWKIMAMTRPEVGRRGDNVSVAPLTTDQAMAAMLRVDPNQLKKLEATEARAKKGKK